MTQYVVGRCRTVVGISLTTCNVHLNKSPALEDYIDSEDSGNPLSKESWRLDGGEADILGYRTFTIIDFRTAGATSKLGYSNQL